MDTIYQDIAARTGGDIYLGVVGPVRTGKSTLIKRIMEALVIPCIDDPYRKERAKDELPQSGSGKMIMTSEPKFVPEEAVEITPDGSTRLRLRMIDSVGYMVDGAVGAHEDGVPRMVTTPWADHEIPMTEAAELGTKKVMQEHCSIGLVVTTDGSITDISRADYVAAERKAIQDMKATGKPFLVVINSRSPGSEEACRVREEISQAFSLEPIILDCQTLEAGGILELFRQLLCQFPIREIRVFLPRWMDALENGHPVKQELYHTLLEQAGRIHTLAQAEQTLENLRELNHIQDYYFKGMDLGTGTVNCAMTFPEELYYEILSTNTGMEIHSDAQLMKLLTELSHIKVEYDKISAALSAVKATGYGVVMPEAEDMKLEKPELQKKGGAFGVKLKAGAPSIHMIRVDVDTEISPTVGSENQTRELIESMNGDELGNSNIFGKSVYDLLQEGLTTKLLRMPDDVRGKFRGTLSRVVNEGATGLICLIL